MGALKHKMQRNKPDSTAFLILLLLSCFVCAAQVKEDEVQTAAAESSKAALLQPRQFAAIAHDSVHKQFLLFGGTYGAQRFDDTWLLGESGWKEQTTKESPSARISSSATYDSVHNEFVLFGGRVQKAKSETCSPGTAPIHLKSEYFCSDTWVFAGGKWIKKAPETAPSPREGHAMAFDATRKEVVLFGGTAAGSSNPLSDTWIWNGANWKQVHPAHHPPARLWHSMAYDPVHREVVLFGGDGGAYFLNDTWLWNGTDWQEARRQKVPPEVRTNAGLDYDATKGKMVLFSGSTWTPRRIGSLALDYWGWDGSEWKQLSSSEFKRISDFSKLTTAEASTATLANGTPSVLRVPIK